MKRIFATLCTMLMLLSMHAASNLAPDATNHHASSFLNEEGVQGSTVEQTPNKAADYLPNTYWSPATKKAGEWIILEWDSPVTLNNIQLQWNEGNFAKEYSIYSLDAIPDTIVGRLADAGMLPDSVAKLLYHQPSRTKLSEQLEKVTVKEVTTKYLLIMMGESATKQPIRLAEIYLFHFEVPKLTRFSIEPRMVAMGVETAMTIQTLDQDGKTITDHIDVSVPDSVGTLKDGKLKATQSGWITVTASDTLNEKELKQRIYVMSDSVAPSKPTEAEVFASLLPASAGTTTYTGFGAKGATPAEGELKLKGQSVKMVHKLGSLAINNDKVTCLKDSTFSPASRLYEKLSLSIFSPTNANGTLRIEEVGSTDLSLKAGEWKTVEVSVADKTLMGNIEIDMEQTAEDSYPEIALANIYFTKSPIRLTSLEAKPQFVVVGDSTKMSLTARDQLSQVVTEHIVYSVDAGSNAKLTDKGWLVAKQHGWLTITATDTISKNKVQTQIYVLGKEDAPEAPDSAAVYAGLLPVTKGTTVYTANTGNKADPADIVRLNKQEVKPVYELGTLVISNSEVSSALGKTFNPAKKYYGKFHMELFSPVAANGTVKVEKVGSKKVALSAGRWTTVEYDVSKVSEMGNIIVEMEKQKSGRYPHLLLANIYFTKAEVDSTDFIMTHIEAGQTFIPKNRPIDLQLTAKNAKGVDVTVYGVKVTYTADKGTFDDKGLFTATADGPITIIGTAGEGELLRRDTIFIYTYPDPDIAPTVTADSVIAVYSDVYGATTYTPSDKTANGGYGQQREIELSLTDKAIYVEHAACFGLKLEELNLEKCDSVHLSIFSYANVQGRLAIDGTQMTNLPFTLKSNQWNHIALPLSGTRNKATWLQIFVGSSSQKNNVIIDNVYFTLDPKYGIIESFTVKQRFVLKNEITDLGLAVYNALGSNITDEVQFTVSRGKLTSPKEYTVTDDGPITITATGALGISRSVTIHTLPDPATKPEDLARRVNAVYSDTYGARTYTASGDYSEQYEVTLAAGDHAIAALDAQEVTLKLNNLDLTDYIWFKASIFSTIDFNGYIEIEGSFMGAIPIELKKYQWTDLKLILTDYRVGITSVKFIVGNEEKKNNVVIDNVLFVKMDPGELDVASQPDAHGFITVLGIINQQNIALINSIPNGGIDLSKATLSNDVHLIEPKNPNTIILVSSETDFDGQLVSSQGKHLIGSKNMVMRSADGTYIPLAKIELTDNEKYPVWTGGIIRTGDLGYSYTRIFYPGATTAFFPTDYTLPAYSERTKEGFKVYTFYQYSADEGVTVANQHNTKIQKNRPYVVTYSNPEGNRKRIVAEATGDLDLRTSSLMSDVLPYNVVFHPNLTRTSNSDWFYLYDRGDKMFFEDVTESTPVPAFRCYFTGCAREYTRRVYLFEGSNRIIISDLEDDPQGTYIVGKINDDNKNTIENINKVLFDLTDATFDSKMSTLTPVNKNALINLYGEVYKDGPVVSPDAEQLDNTKNIVIKDDNGQFYSFRDIILTDDGNSPVWVGGTVETRQNGYSYSRTLGAFECTTAVVPMPIDVPDGVELYTLTGYTNEDGLELTRVFDEVLTPHLPYIIYNINEVPVELKGKSTGTLNLLDSTAKSIKFSERSDIELTANYGPNTGDDWIRYGIKVEPTGNAARGRGVPKMTVSLEPYAKGYVMPPFRAYFTHIPADGSKSITMTDKTKILAVSEPDDMGFVTVTGLLDNSNKKQVENATAAGIDLSKAIIDDELTTLTPANPNTLIMVPGSIDEKGDAQSAISSQLTGTRNMVLRTGTNTMTALSKIYIIDNDKQRIPWGDILIDTRELGFSYQRTIAAKQLTTITIPEYSDVPEGLELYIGPSYVKNESFTFYVNEATLLSKDMPFIAYNLSDKDIEMKSEGTGYLDLRSSAAGSRRAGPGSFFANYSLTPVTEDKPIWYIRPSDMTLQQVEPGTILQPFRAYFTGIPENLAVIFGDGTLGVRDIMADADIQQPYYTLDGRRVTSPKKGSLYIRNGKKVVFRKK